MKPLLLLGVACLLVLPIDVSSEDHICSLGFREDTEVIQGPETEVFCPATSLRRHDDGGYENAFCWRYMGNVSPDYGSWAECYESDYVCAIEFLFTQEYHSGETMDVYIWESDPEGNPPPGPDPGNVICYLPDVYPGTIAEWPEISAHNVEVCCYTGGAHFVGYWGNWPGDRDRDRCGWFVAVDEDGFYGFGEPCPRTKIAPGIGYETGWNHPNVHPIMADVVALGIREFAGPGDCGTSSAPDPDDPVPATAEPTTWGKIKALY